MGDKSQLLAMTLAHRYRVAPVIAGTFAAFALLNLLAVLLGQVLWTVSLVGILFGATLLRKIPKHWVHRAAALLFVTFGFLALGQVLLNGNGLSLI